MLGLIEQDEEGNLVDVDPKDSNRVFVDVTAYNSKNYYIQGDVAAPGKLPITGNETVLDAINYAGGLIPTAAPQNIRLVRPAPPGSRPAGLPGRPRGDHRVAGDRPRTTSSCRATASSSAATRSSGPRS